MFSSDLMQQLMQRRHGNMNGGTAGPIPGQNAAFPGVAPTADIAQNVAPAAAPVTEQPPAAPPMGQATDALAAILAKRNLPMPPAPPAPPGMGGVASGIGNAASNIGNAIGNMPAPPAPPTPPGMGFLAKPVNTVAGGLGGFLSHLFGHKKHPAMPQGNPVMVPQGLYAGSGDDAVGPDVTPSY